jgi:hypothetical protein
MANVQFQYAFYVGRDGGYIVGNSSTTTVSDSLNIGDAVQIPSGPFTLTVYYQGFDQATHDPFFTEQVMGGGGVYRLTNNETEQGSTYNGRVVQPFAACFLAGTLIATPDGPRAVEDLVIGASVLTAGGGVAKVKWLGRQTVAALFDRAEDRAPIRIAAGALGDDLPVRDLKLTADHALLLSGVLVQAGALVNGATIRRMTAAETGERYTVFHVETEGHQIILAEGVPAETFVDNVTRQRFDNYAEYAALYGEDGETIAELDLPRVKSARQLPAGLRGRIATPRAA